MSLRARIFIGILTACVIAGAASIVHADGMDVAGHSGSGSRSITGRVVDPAGRPVGGVCIQAFVSDGPSPEIDGKVAYEGLAVSDPSGIYAMRAMLPGDYKLWFGHCNDRLHPVVPVWYRNTATFDRAAHVHVTYDQDTIGVDEIVVAVPISVSP